MGEDRDHEGGSGARQRDGEFPPGDHRREDIRGEAPRGLSDERRVHDMGIRAAPEEVSGKDSGSRVDV